MGQTSKLFELAGEIWMLIFAASFLSSIVAGVIQTLRGKEIWDTPALPLLAFLHFAWVMPLVAPILFPCLAYVGLRWLWRRMTRRSAP